MNRTKWLFSYFRCLVVLLALTTWMVSLAAATQLTVRDMNTRQTDVEVLPGDVLELELFVDVGDLDVNGFSLLILYDPEYLQAMDMDTGKPGVQPCRQGAFLPGLELQNAVDASIPGKPKILYSIGAIGSMASGTGVVAELQLSVLAPIDTTRVELAIGGPQPQTQYSVAGTNPRTEVFDELVSTEVHIRGIPDWDANQDGAVDILDLVTVGQHFGEQPVTDPGADVNGDGSVDILDMVAIGRHFGERYRP